ncbi:FadR family transcriptional regulator [bacterium]|nr:MAG: FadR family transcriptional regulator [bacterium]
MISALNELGMVNHPLTAAPPSRQSCFNRFARIIVLLLSTTLTGSAALAGDAPGLQHVSATGHGERHTRVREGRSRSHPSPYDAHDTRGGRKSSSHQTSFPSMAAYKHVAPKRLHVQIVEAIVGRIVSGELQPGVFLPPESELALQFGTSRTVVREALRVLADKGLVEIRHGAGTRVTDPERWDPLDASILVARRERGTMVSVLQDLMEARSIFECEVAALAAERAEQTHLARMDAAIKMMHATVEMPVAFGNADSDFHRAILEATGNSVLLKMGDSMRELLTFSQQTTSALPGHLERALADHIAIYRAVKRGDAAGARSAMRRHLARTERHVKELLRL